MRFKPYWAYRVVGPDECEAARIAHHAETLVNNWSCSDGFRKNLCTKPPLKKPPKAWARSKGWPTPIFSFEKRFMQTMFCNEQNFRMVLEESDVELFVPIDRYVISKEEVTEWNRKNKNPRNWDGMARSFQVLCALIRLGITLEVDGQDFTDSSDFYNNYIYKNFRNLEEGADIFILSDPGEP